MDSAAPEPKMDCNIMGGLETDSSYFTGGAACNKKAKLAILLVLVVVVIIAWRGDKLNKILPDKLRHRPKNISGFTGLIRSGQYTTAPGGKPGVPGIDLNTSDWV